MIYKIFKILNKKEIFSIIIIILLSFFNAILELIGITLIIPILSFFSPRTYYSNASINLILNFFSYIGIEVFSAVCLLLIFIFLVKSFLSIYIIFYINRFNNNLLIRISDKIFKNYLFKDYVFHLNNHSSKILTDTNTETNYFVFYVVSSIIQILVGLIFLFYISCFLFFLDKFVFISLLLVFSFIAFLYSKIFSKKINKLGNIRYQNASLAIKQIQESLGGIKEVILFNVQKYFLEKYSFYNTNNAQSNLKSNTIFQIPRILFELLMVILITIYLFFFTVRNSELSEIIIILSTFVVSATRLIPAINKILGSYQNIKYRKKSVNVIYLEINSPQNKNINSKKNFIFKSLIFDKVYFKHIDQNKYIFKSLNFTIKKGDKIGIQGTSGVGKTTFVNLISGLHSPTAGKILINNNLANNNFNVWRSKIGYVPQKVFLLDDTIKNNILFGRKEKDFNLNDIFKILKKFQILEFILNLENSINTAVGENGQKMSGGQIQRIGIIRALLHKPSVLILDESTSSLDLETEKSLIDNIYSNFNNLTIVSISHRLSALRFCNKIYEVKNSSLNRIK